MSLPPDHQGRERGVRIGRGAGDCEGVSTRGAPVLRSDGHLHHGGLARAQVDGIAVRGGERAGGPGAARADRGRAAGESRGDVQRAGGVGHVQGVGRGAGGKGRGQGKALARVAVPVPGGGDQVGQGGIVRQGGPAAATAGTATTTTAGTAATAGTATRRRNRHCRHRNRRPCWSPYSCRRRCRNHCYRCWSASSCRRRRRCYRTAQVQCTVTRGLVPEPERKPGEAGKRVPEV